MIDFDNIDDWAPKLNTAIRRYVPDTVKQALIEATPEYEWTDDVQKKLFELTNRDMVIDAVIAWIQSNEVAGYHGSRLTDEEVNSVKENGLIPLEAAMRRDRLTRVLSPHTRWPEVADQLDPIIQAYGLGNHIGNRVGQVHLTLSRAGLIKGFNHYLTHGSEFDQHVAKNLLGPEGMDLLAKYGEPRVFQITVPGDSALEAAHPTCTIDNLRNKGDVPNLVKEFLTLWCYRLICPSIQTQTLKVDCGMVFRKSIPPDRITHIDTLSDAYIRDTLSINSG